MWTEAFVKELTAFPFVRHDDSVDAFVWALTYYSIKMDTVDKGLQDSIIQSRKWAGNFQRSVLEDKTYGSAIESGSFRNRRRGITGESHMNDPDYNSGPGSFGGPRSRSQRGAPGYSMWD